MTSAKFSKKIDFEKEEVIVCLNGVSKTFITFTSFDVFSDFQIWVTGIQRDIETQSLAGFLLKSACKPEPLTKENK